MPLHDEEMNRRREKREAQRRRQQAEAKRLKMTLALAAVVLLLCGVGIYRLTQNLPQKEVSQTEQKVQETKAPKETEKPTAPVEVDPVTTIHIKAAGDLNVTNSVVNSGMAIGGYDFAPVFKDVASILADGDITVMNIEGNFVGEPYGTVSTSAPNQLLTDLRSCGVDLLQAANSCIINNGMIGLTSTLNSIRNAGIEPLGAYATESEFREGKGYTIAEVKGKRQSEKQKCNRRKPESDTLIQLYFKPCSRFAACHPDEPQGNFSRVVFECHPCRRFFPCCDYLRKFR